MDAQTRSVRLTRLLELFRGSRTGYTVRELAQTTRMHVRSIQRDLKALQWEMNQPLIKKASRYVLEQAGHLGPINLTLHEARALLIATRLFLRYSDESDPHA